MRDIVWLTGTLVIVLVVGILHLWTTERRVAKARDYLDASVPAPLTAGVEAWLRPTLARRDRWIGLGLLFGVAVSWYPVRHGLDDLPWPCFTLALGITAGTTLGTLVAGYRASPRPRGGRRVSKPVLRRWSDFVSHRDLLTLRLALPMPFAALGFAGMIAVSGRRELGLLTLVLCGIAAAVVVVSIWVAAVLTSRPMASGAPDEILWHEALLRLTLDPLTGRVRLIAWFSGFVAVYSSVVARHVLPWWVLALTALFGLYCIAAAALAFRPTHHTGPIRPERVFGTTPW